MDTETDFRLNDTAGGMPGDPDRLPPDSYVFISYSHEDYSAAAEIMDILRRNGIAFWYDQRIKSGRAWTAEISNRIKNCCQFMLLLSRSAQESPNVYDEISVARNNKKSFVIVYLEDLELAEGFDILIGRLQGIIRSKFPSLRDFEERLCAEISPRARTDYAAARNATRQRDDSLLSKITARYDLVKELGRKGTRKTFLGKSKTTRLPVFIKQYVVSPDAPENTFLFESEKTALTTCFSPALPRLLDVYEDDTGGYLVESFLFGETLSRRRGLDQREALNIGIQLCRALAALHRANLVHCDVKPDNVVISELGDVYLVDFNSAQSLLHHTYAWSRGTARFAAPEQYEREYRPDCRTDFYGLGRTLEAVLSLPEREPPRAPLYPEPGEDREPTSRIIPLPVPRDTGITVPREGDTLFPEDWDKTGILYGMTQRESAQPLRRDLHPRFRALLDRLTAYRAQDRPRSCQEVLEELERCRLVLDLEKLL